jgi:hypothetical protein
LRNNRRRLTKPITTGQGSTGQTLVPEIVTEGVRLYLYHTIQDAAAKMHADMDEFGVHDDDPCRRIIDTYKKRAQDALVDDNLFKEAREKTP